MHIPIKEHSLTIERLQVLDALYVVLELLGFLPLTNKMLPTAWSAVDFRKGLVYALARPGGG
jgi:hypothetical protein